MRPGEQIRGKARNAGFARPMIPERRSEGPAWCRHGLLLLAGLLCLLMFRTGTAAAEPAPLSAQAANEINFLLGAIGSSGCEFLRNGSWHGAQQAREHLEQKYKWLTARGRVRSAEDFIELAGSRSSISGQSYAVRCAGRPQLSSSSWLTEQLRRHRAAGGASGADPEAGPGR